MDFPTTDPPHTPHTLEEIKLEINNFQEEFEGDWSKVRERVDKIGRTNEKASVVTAHVHLVVNDPAVKELKGHAFFSCANLARLDLPYVEEVGGFATASSYALRHVTVRSDVKVAPNAFAYCLSLEVLADACDFVTRGKKTNSGRNNATTGITQYLHWRKQMDENKQNYYTLITMLKLCNSVKKNSLLGWLGLDLPMRATSEDSVMKFLIAAGDDIAGQVLSFKYGEKRGKGDLRTANRQELLKVGLERSIIRMENNGWGNKQYWGVAVDEKGTVVELAKAISGGLVTLTNASWIWGLTIRMNGSVVDKEGYYGEKGHVVGRVNRQTDLIELIEPMG
ncbi:hypothetical protein TrCOL_g12633 [Triparma columacea]|uniref:Uncharacterized protein n=1 Tax=Triparma columacea TaxID=722753 RepID=A0A9W7G1E1_9STRA|nr:hypothetical protein TrCOL_g12633 [Triparma columacea]